VRRFTPVALLIVLTIGAVSASVASFSVPPNFNSRKFEALTFPPTVLGQHRITVSARGGYNNRVFDLRTVNWLWPTCQWHWDSISGPKMVAAWGDKIEGVGLNVDITFLSEVLGPASTSSISDLRRRVSYIPPHCAGVYGVGSLYTGFWQPFVCRSSGPSRIDPHIDAPGIIAEVNVNNRSCHAATLWLMRGGYVANITVSCHKLAHCDYALEAAIRYFSHSKIE
jgi:hypothetical protein